MNDKEASLKIKINYNSNFFYIQNNNFITFKQLKEESIKRFKLEKNEKLLQFSLINNDNIIISSDDDIIKYLDDTNPLMSKLKLNLSIIDKKDNIKSIKTSNINKSNINQNQNESIYYKKIKEEFDKIRSQINILKKKISNFKMIFEKLFKKNKKEIEDIVKKINDKFINEIKNMNNKIESLQKENKRLNDIIYRINNIIESNKNKLIQNDNETFQVIKEILSQSPKIENIDKISHNNNNLCNHNHPNEEIKNYSNDNKTNAPKGHIKNNKENQNISNNKKDDIISQKLNSKMKKIIIKLLIKIIKNQMK